MPYFPAYCYQAYPCSPHSCIFPRLKGKDRNFQDYSPCHRTTIAHFLNKGKWDSARLEDILKDAVTDFIYREALATRKPVFCIVDDTIASKTKPSSRALHPIEDAYFHQSHLKGVFIQQAR